MKAENAKNLHVPLYKGLSIESMLEMGTQDKHVAEHLPDERDIRRLPRAWVCNLIYSLKGDEFREWVSGLIRGRNEHLALKNDLMIELDPQIAEAFKISQNISSKFSFVIVEALKLTYSLYFHSSQGQRCSHS